MNMPDPFEASSDARALRLAAALAVVAAVFMVAVWAPLQIRAFDEAVATDRPSAASSGTDWERLQLVTPTGELTNVAAMNGRVRIVTMVYAHCPGVCPLALSTLRNIERRLPLQHTNQLRVVAIGLDSANDTPEALNRVASSFSPPGSHWIVGMPSRDGVSGFARALGVRYRPVGDGTIDHQSVFVLLDRQGKVLARTERTQQIDTAFVAALNAALN
jgi:protein SCO1/2